MSDATAFEYSNLSGRPPGPFVSAAGRVLRGVREVQAQVQPYAAAWEAHNRVAVASDGPLWVVLGDSMSQGVGASAFDRGWVGQLMAGLPHRVVNLSVSGGRLDDVLERQLPALEALGPADLVTLMVGSNDLLSRRHRERIPERAAEVLRRLPAGTVVANQPGGRAAAVAYNRQIDDAAAAGRVVVAEFRDPRMRSWRGRLAADRFHPNDLGYAGMAEIVAEAIARR